MKFREGTGGSVFLASMLEGFANTSSARESGSENELLKLGIVPVAVGILTIIISHSRYRASSLHFAMLAVFE
jgi:hypothetical protein